MLCTGSLEIRCKEEAHYLDANILCIKATKYHSVSSK